MMPLNRKKNPREHPEESSITQEIRAETGGKGCEMGVLNR